MTSGVFHLFIDCAVELGARRREFLIIDVSGSYTQAGIFGVSEGRMFVSVVAI